MMSKWMRWLVCALLLGCFGSAAPARAQTYDPFDCPYDPYLYTAKCQKLARRHQKREQRQAYTAEIESYREQHPWRVSALGDFSLLGLGLGHAYVAGGWSFGAGIAALRELAPGWALRLDLLGRVGRAHINSWNFDSPGPIDATAGTLAGVDTKVALLRRIRALYVGPAFSAGLVHLRARTLREADQPDADEGDRATLHVPGNRAFVSMGLLVGGEPVPRGPFSLNFHFAPGIWKDMHHLYLSASLAVTVKIWD